LRVRLMWAANFDRLERLGVTLWCKEPELGLVVMKM